MPVTKIKSKWTSGNLQFTDSSGNEIATLDSANRRLSLPAASALLHNKVVQNLRMRFTVAQVDAGATLLAALAGYGYRMVDCQAIAIGGAAATVTTVDIIGTLSSARKLVAFAQANLTQSTVLRVGNTGAAVLADGASHTVNDVNTAITIGKTGGAVGTATHIDVIFSYTIEA